MLPELFKPGGVVAVSFCKPAVVVPSVAGISSTEELSSVDRALFSDEKSVSVEEWVSTEASWYVEASDSVFSGVPEQPVATAKDNAIVAISIYFFFLIITLPRIIVSDGGKKVLYYFIFV